VARSLLAQADRKLPGLNHGNHNKKGGVNMKGAREAFRTEVGRHCAGTCGELPKESGRRTREDMRGNQKDGT